MPDEVTTLYRPVGTTELAYSGFAVSQVSGKPAAAADLLSVLSEEHATRIARDWNTKDEASGFAGYILRFKLRGEFLSPYKLHRVGSAQHPKYLDSEPRGSGSGMFTMDVSPRAGS